VIASAQIIVKLELAIAPRLRYTLTVETNMTVGERYQVRAKISMLFREANLFEDRQTEEGRVKARELRQQADAMNEELRRK